MRAKRLSRMETANLMTSLRRSVRVASLDHGSERGLQGRAAHQKTIDVGLGDQSRAVFRVRAATVLDSHLRGGQIAAPLRNVSTNAGVRLLCLLRRSHLAGANGPHRL